MALPAKITIRVSQARSSQRIEVSGTGSIGNQQMNQLNVIIDNPFATSGVDANSVAAAILNLVLPELT
jgi:hypothetical protein